VAVVAVNSNENSNKTQTMNLVDVRVFGPTAFSTDCITVSPPLAYFLFKLGHVGLASSNRQLCATTPTHDGSEEGDDAFALLLRTPQRWPTKWTASMPYQKTFLQAVFPVWGCRDDGNLACVAVSVSAASHAPLRPQSLCPRVDVDGVPSFLAPFLEMPLSRSVSLDTTLFFSSLTCRVAANMIVPITFDATCAPKLYRVVGANAGSRAIEPLAHVNGQLAAMWDLQNPASDAHLREWNLPLPLQGHVGTWAFACPVRAAGQRAMLLCCPIHYDAGFLHCDWASGVLPQQLWELFHATTQKLPLSVVDAVVLPWSHMMTARSRVPALGGLVHPRIDRECDQMAGAAVIDSAMIRVTLAWDAACCSSSSSAGTGVDATRTRRHKREDSVRKILALPENCGISFVVVINDAVVACLLIPGHLLVRNAAQADVTIAPINLQHYIPWGRQ
jgi:hypothetical protein